MCFYKTSHGYIDPIGAEEFPLRDLQKIASPWKESANNWLEVNYFQQGDNWDKDWNNQTICWIKITVCIQNSLFVVVCDSFFNWKNGLVLKWQDNQLTTKDLLLKVQRYELNCSQESLCVQHDLMNNQIYFYIAYVWKCMIEETFS